MIWHQGWDHCRVCGAWNTGSCPKHGDHDAQTETAFLNALKEMGVSVSPGAKLNPLTPEEFDALFGDLPQDGEG